MAQTGTPPRTGSPWLQLFPQPVRTPQGLFEPLPSPTFLVVLGLVLAAAIALTLLERGHAYFSAIFPVAVYARLVMLRVRWRGQPGAPIVMLDGSTLQLRMPNDLGRVRDIELTGIRTISFYGPGLLELAVIHNDGRVDRYHPAWGHRRSRQVMSFLQDALPDQVEIREGDLPTFFETVRGQYDP